MTTDVRPASSATEITERLAPVFRGELIAPDNPAYEVHRRVWNFDIDRRPALIARCAGVADVIAAVKAARASGIATAVRSGGHSFPGLSVCDDGFVIDLSLMKGMRVSPDRKTVRAQAGVLLGELDRETQAFATAVPAGIVTTTGLAGLTLGGGIGWLMRKYGLTADQLLSVDMVTADGDLVRASEDENADLFWGIRGAGANFGIVTEFEFRLNPLGPTVLAGPMAWPMEDAPKLLRFYREWAAGLPDEMTTGVVLRKAPSLPVIPAEVHGRRVVMVVACHAGPVEDGQRLVQPLRDFAPPLVDLCAPKPFLAHQSMFDAGLPRGWSYYFRSCDVAGLSDAVIDVVVRHGMAIGSPTSAIVAFQLGGAMARVPEDASAFNGRGSAFTFNITGNSPDPAAFPPEREWVKKLWSDLEPHNSGAYVNFLMDEGEDRVRRSYGPEKFARLQALKRKYDPQNFFRLNQNIAP
jgi:FAD/FMN-containing dehydrogenase